MFVRLMIAAGVSVLVSGAFIGARAQDRTQVQAAVDRFAATDVGGRTVTVRDLRGRVVLLEFWATWCAPCLADIPWLQRARRQYPETFEVVGISLDVIDRAAFMSWIRRQDIGWTQIHDGRGWASPLITPFGFDRIPFNVLVDAEGRVIGTDVRAEKLMHALEALLGQKAMTS